MLEVINVYYQEQDPHIADGIHGPSLSKRKPFNCSCQHTLLQHRISMSPSVVRRKVIECFVAICKFLDCEKQLLGTLITSPKMSMRQVVPILIWPSKPLPLKHYEESLSSLIICFHEI